MRDLTNKLLKTAAGISMAVSSFFISGCETPGDAMIAAGSLPRGYDRNLTPGQNRFGNAILNMAGSVGQARNERDAAAAGRSQIIIENNYPQQSQPMFKVKDLDTENIFWMPGVYDIYEDNSALKKQFSKGYTVYFRDGGTATWRPEWERK